MIRRAYLEITNICNLKCSFCPSIERPPQVMPLALLTHVIKQLPALIDEVFLHLMGEPLSHPYLSDIIDLCASEQLPIHLVTNGTLLDEIRSDLVLHPAVRQVNISLHAFEDNFNLSDAIQATKNVLSFLHKAQSARADLYINLRLWDLKEAKQTTFNINGAIRELLSTEFGVDLMNISVDVRRKKNILLAGRIYLHNDLRFTWPSLALPLRGSKGFCYALSNQFGILSDGTVVPCCLDKDGLMNLGNCTETPIAAILQGERAQKIRKGFASGKLVENLCQHCTFISRFARKKT